MLQLVFPARPRSLPTHRQPGPTSLNRTAPGLRLRTLLWKRGQSYSCTLPLGDYQLVVVGRTYSTGDTFTLTSATEAAYTSEKVRDTFCAHQPVTVYSTAPQNLQITLSRISSMLRVVSTDNRTTQATQIRTPFGAGGKGFNPTTGLATTNTGFTVVNHLTSAVGDPIAIYSYLYRFKIFIYNIIWNLRRYL